MGWPFTLASTSDPWPELWQPVLSAQQIRREVPSKQARNNFKPKLHNTQMKWDERWDCTVPGCVEGLASAGNSASRDVLSRLSRLRHSSGRSRRRRRSLSFILQSAINHRSQVRLGNGSGEALAINKHRGS